VCLKKPSPQWTLKVSKLFPPKPLKSIKRHGLQKGCAAY
jgi:hypothetical protein